MSLQREVPAGWKPGFPVRKDRKRTRFEALDAQENDQDGWRYANKPEDLVHIMTDSIAEEDLERLAGVATGAALAEIGDYVTPHVRNAARSAVAMALGLKPLPQEQGEQ